MITFKDKVTHTLLHVDAYKANVFLRTSDFRKIGFRTVRAAARREERERVEIERFLS